MDGGAWWAAVHGVARSRTRLSDFTFTFHFHALEKAMATHSSVLAWRIPGTGSLVGCRLWGRTESDMTEATQQQQQQHYIVGHFGSLLLFTLDFALSNIKIIESLSLFFFFCLHQAFLVACRLSLLVASKGYPLAVEYGLSSCGTPAQLPRGMWDLPGPGIEPMSPALAGGFFTTGPPWKFSDLFLAYICLLHISYPFTFNLSGSYIFKASHVLNDFHLLTVSAVRMRACVHVCDLCVICSDIYL